MFFFVSDFHLLIDNFNNVAVLKKNVNRMVVDWLSSGLDPDVCNIFVQSSVPECIELYVLLSMIVPINSMKNTLTCKEKIYHLYDVLLYKADYFFFEKGCTSHIEFIKNIIKKFDFLYNNNINIYFFINNIIDYMNFDNSLFLKHILKEYCYRNWKSILECIDYILSCDNILDIYQKNILYKYLQNDFLSVFLESKELSSNVFGLYGLNCKKNELCNVIFLTDSPFHVKKKIDSIITYVDKRNKYFCEKTNNCSVFVLHKLYSNRDFIEFLSKNCNIGKISCLDCKKLISNNIIIKNAFIRKNSIKYIKNPNIVLNILKNGSKKAREVASETLSEIKRFIGI